MSHDLESDLPVIQGLLFPEEPESPTAILTKKPKNQYLILFLDGRTLEIRDSRSIVELTQAWMKAMNHQEQKQNKNNVEVMRVSIEMRRKQEEPFGSSDDIHTPSPWKNDIEDLMIFGGDSDGAGACSVLASYIKGIARPV